MSPCSLAVVLHVFICIYCLIFKSSFLNTSNLRCKYAPSIVRKEKFAFVLQTSN